MDQNLAGAGQPETKTENNAPKPPTINETDLLVAIYENTRKTKNYMMWQFYITIVLVVLPLLAMLLVVPYVFRTLSSVYGPSSGLLQ